NELAARADVVLAIGTRLSDFTTASMTAFAAPGVRFVAFNVAGADAAKVGALPLVADAQRGLDALGEALKGWRTSEQYAGEVDRLRREWLQEVERLRATGPAEAGDRSGTPEAPLSQAQAIGRVNEAFGGRATVIN